MVGIIGAMDIEIARLNEEMTEKNERVIAGITFTFGKINKKDIVTGVSGMGKVNASICAQIMIMEFKPEVIINTGVAGAIKKDLKICDIVIASALYEHDLDLTPVGYPLGYISGADIVKIPSAEAVKKDLLECAKKLDDKISVIEGVIVTGDQFINSREKKEFLKERFDAVACEMEGGAIGHVCYLNKVPFAVVRAMSDNAGESANMDFEAFSKKAAQNSVNLLLEYIGE